MGLGFKKVIGTGSIPVFQGYGKDISLAQGGFGLDITGLRIGAIIPAGTPMICDESTRLAKPFVTAKLTAAATNTDVAYKVTKNSLFAIGDNFSAVKGAKAYPITAIDTSNAGYDLVTVGTTLGAVLAEGTLVFESTATGATASALPGLGGVLYSDSIIEAGESVSVAIKATVYARRVPYTADIAAALPRIIYSQSY
ncbi:hypothetical protein DBR40_05315 [Pedobacter sp. KBW01]|uniref:hypothetical protein n=1 Tax=Pedobacter sp. KBW01 TaxID=2153364 RepID=UPI000F5A637A|nr:hypothetical protein [Pedobacter sp. KBW01]RQO79140.1 hypothetical protein DBR40_05315 [Pedobacter sp. KBW01]